MISGNSSGAGGSSTNVAASANGGVTTASTSYSSQYPASEMNDGDRRGVQGGGNVGCWADVTGNVFPDWVQVDFNGSKSITEVSLFSLQDNYQSPVEPTETMTFNTYGNQDFDVQYWTGSSWQTVPGGSVTGNNKVWRKITFAAVTTTKVRVTINDAASPYSYVTELEVWGTEGGAGGSFSADINWLVTDHLGTPRIIADESGSLAGIKRHDYLPFGEELFSGTGNRTIAKGYSGDAVRQKFTLKERDNETNLDYSINRYYSNVQGRFTSVDPKNAGGDSSYPQSWNGYAYAHNNPLRYIDPDGLDIRTTFNGGGGRWYTEKEFEKYKRDLAAEGFVVKGGKIIAPVYDDDNNIIGGRVIGTYSSDMNDFGQGVSAELARRNPAMQQFGKR